MNHTPGAVATLDPELDVTHTSYRPLRGIGPVR